MSFNIHNICQYRQEKGESLRAFMERLNKLSLYIRNLSPKVVVHHLVTTLRSSSFVDSLFKKSGKNLYKLKQRATKFMQLEELCDYRNNV